MLVVWFLFRLLVGVPFLMLGGLLRWFGVWLSGVRVIVDTALVYHPWMGYSVNTQRQSSWFREMVQYHQQIDDAETSLRYNVNAAVMAEKEFQAAADAEEEEGTHDS